TLHDKTFMVRCKADFLVSIACSQRSATISLINFVLVRVFVVNELFSSSHGWHTKSQIMTDAELIAGIRSRQREAFDLFYDRYAQIIFNLCLRILKDETDAEDVVQEIFVQTWKEADRFDATRASVKTWLFT